MSPSSRRAWVEITTTWSASSGGNVALLAEGVGRNPRARPGLSRAQVALLAEGVGRNHDIGGVDYKSCVALLAEGVGRNDQTWTRPMPIYRSPSSRRAWVEMDSLTKKWAFSKVALLAEGVGRNWYNRIRKRGNRRRPPRGGRG